MNLYIAPVQGHTDAPWRHFHTLSYSPQATAFTPFIRLEHDALRPRDLRDFTSPLNENTPVVPQVIFRDARELRMLVALLREHGATRIDLNMGCPFPLQTGHGRGAATVANRNVAEAVAETVNGNPDILFSVKMRLGMERPDEWKGLLPVLNGLTLAHITLHPRVARQQYGGDVQLDSFARFLAESRNPVVYNGDIRSLADFSNVVARFPDLKGVMVGRGLLGRPSLINEIAGGKEWTREERLRRMLEFHRSLYTHFIETLCGDSQVIAKIKPFWEYAEDEIGRKAWKAIKKAGNIAKYNSAVALINEH